ncbi:hypothetical protein ACFO9Q_02980 [Paenibacillus sp. GCM10023252]|uniref:hypothetical protein n=1 Tax=Paenibacillus sp. GCM10023252 TaxID=3252649 RepID=UPI00360CCFDA
MQTVDGATHGKDTLFKGLGYSKKDSSKMTKIQRIEIVVELKGQGSGAGKAYKIISGWMLRWEGTLTLSIPFSGFTGR